MADFEFEEEDFTATVNVDTLQRILKQAKPHWRYLAGIVCFIGLVSITDHLFTLLSKEIIDSAIAKQDVRELYRIAKWYALFIVIQASMVMAFIYSAGRLSLSVQYDLRQQMFDHLQELSLSYYDKTAVGWIISRVTSDTRRMGELISWGVLDTLWGVFSISSAMGIMLYLNWRLGLLVCLIIPLLIVIATEFKKKILVEYRWVRKLNSQITGSYNENITGVRVAKALVREEENLKEFQTLSSSMYRSSFKAAWLSALFLPIVQMISAGGIALVAWYGGWQVEQGGLTIGGIYAFVSFITFMLWPVQEMARVYSELQQAIASAERVFSLLDLTPEIVERNGSLPVDSLKKRIEFSHIDFYYEKEKPVLKDFNLVVESGETVALVGQTGGGKSTIVNLLCRFYEPQAGSLSFGGVDYRSLSLSGIQSRIGIVLQTPHLFSGTIRENIRYGRLNATDEALEEATRLAGAEPFILELENGYETEVGEGGVLLSVGQKQLLSLARAILAQPDIFIMDEATSSVDTMTESLIQKGMEAVMKQSTSFVIAHRLSTIKRADRILVIDNGRITENGTHKELLRQKGHYYRLYTQQFRQERLNQIDLIN